MVNKTENYQKITINQDKLIDILMHAATREDINKLDGKIDKLQATIREDMNKLDGKIDRVHTVLSADINKLETKVDGMLEKVDFEKFEVRTNDRFDKLEAKQDKIFWGIVIAFLVPVSIQIFTQFIK